MCVLGEQISDLSLYDIYILLRPYWHKLKTSNYITKLIMFSHNGVVTRNYITAKNNFMLTGFERFFFIKTRKNLSKIADGIQRATSTVCAGFLLAFVHRKRSFVARTGKKYIGCPSRLASLGIKEAQLRAPLTPLTMICCRDD